MNISDRLFDLEVIQIYPTGQTMDEHTLLLTDVGSIHSSNKHVIHAQEKKRKESTPQQSNVIQKPTYPNLTYTCCTLYPVPRPRALTKFQIKYKVRVICRVTNILPH